MQNIDISISNYRCFSDEIPGLLRIGPGFTALIGPNNTGKSTVIRMFHELRDVFKFFAGIENNRNRTRLQVIQYPNVADPSELLHNFDTNSMSISFRFRDVPEKVNCPFVTEFTLHCDADGQRHNWSIRYSYSGKLDTDVDGVWRGNHQAISFMGKYLGYNGIRFLDLSNVLDTLSDFSNSIYFGPFRNAITSGSGEYFDLPVGDRFIATWDEWKAGTSKRANMLAKRVTSDIKEIFGFSELEIDEAFDTSGKTLQVSIDGLPFKLREVGSGIAQFIIVIATAAIKGPPIIFIDEPELHLHPALQQKFTTALASYSSTGTIVFSTHSLGLARVTADRIYSLRRESGRVRIEEFANSPEYLELIGELSFESMRELGIDTLLLVEGVTDVRVAQVLLRFYDKGNRVVIVPLGGDDLANGKRDSELSEFKKIGSRVFALVDSEREEADGEPSKARRQFAKSSAELGFDSHLTKFKSIENYFPTEAIRSVFGDRYEPMDQYAKAPWDKSHNWRIVQCTSREFWDSTDIGEFLKRI